MICASVPVWETPNRPSNIKCIIPAFFGDRIVAKEGGLRTHNPSAEEVGGLQAFLYLATQNQEKNSRSKFNNFKKHIAVDVLTKTFAMILLSGRSNLTGRYHSGQPQSLLAPLQRLLKLLQTTMLLLSSLKNLFQNVISGIFSSSMQRELIDWRQTLSCVNSVMLVFSTHLCDTYSPLLPLSTTLWFTTTVPLSLATKMLQPLKIAQ